MKKAVMISIVCILLMGGTITFMSAKNSEKLSAEVQGWLSWYNSLSDEAQENIHYIPSELQNTLDIKDETKEFISINKLSEETRKWLKWYGKLSHEEQTAISYVPAELQELLKPPLLYDAPFGNTE